MCVCTFVRFSAWILHPVFRRVDQVQCMCDSEFRSVTFCTISIQIDCSFHILVLVFRPPPKLLSCASRCCMHFNECRAKMPLLTVFDEKPAKNTGIFVFSIHHYRIICCINFCFTASWKWMVSPGIDPGKQTPIRNSVDGTRAHTHTQKKKTKLRLSSQSIVQTI